MLEDVTHGSRTDIYNETPGIIIKVYCLFTVIINNKYIDINTNIPPV